MYERIGGRIKQFALPSLYNYLYAVVTILADRKSYSDFVNDRVKAYGKVKARNLTNGNKRRIYEQLFSAYRLGNSLMMLESLKEKQKQVLNAVAVVTSYYAIYSLSKTFILLKDGSFQETHAGTYRKFSDICDDLAYPFCLKGKRKDGSDNSELDLINPPKGFDLSRIDTKALTLVNETHIDPESAIYEYWKGTAQWYWENDKQGKRRAVEECSKEGYGNFRTKEARRIRDDINSRMKPVNFLSCFFRIRGKSNYRDSLFDLYDLNDRSPFALNEKSEKIIHLLLEIFKYYSLDVESYMKARADSTLHSELMNDIDQKTRYFDLFFPREFQLRLL